MTGAAPRLGVVVPCAGEQTALGTCLRWDGRRGELLRVESSAGCVFRDAIDADGALDRIRTYRLPMAVGAITPIRGDDGWLLAAGRGFVHLSPDGASRALVDVVPDGACMNDGACDPHGRFWAGSVADDQRVGGGAIHRLGSSGSVDTVLDGLTVPNGVAWSGDGETMYVIDSGLRVVLEFAFDRVRGSISAGHILISVPRDDGTPSGLTVDAADQLWVALYGGGCVRRYDRQGRLRDEVAVPARQTTSCAFAGPGLDRLYIATSTNGWTAEQRRSDPAAGLVYWVRTGVTGRAAAPFVPDRRWWDTVVGQAG